MSVAWAPMAAEDGSQIRGIVLTELARLLAEAPGAVSLDAVATRGNDLFLTLRVPRARLAKVFGERGTPEDPVEKKAEENAAGASRGAEGQKP